MRARWIDAVTFMEVADAALFDHVLERTIFGLEVSLLGTPR